MTDSRGLATLATTELDIVTSAATTVYVPIIVNDVPKRITLANLISALSGEIAFTDLSDTPANYTSSGSDTLKVTAGADAVEFVTV